MLDGLKQGRKIALFALICLAGTFCAAEARRMSIEEFAGSSAQSSSMRPLSGASPRLAIEPADAKPRIFVSNGANAVNIFAPSGQLVSQIGGLGSPAGLATDAAANLYVAVLGNGYVGIFPPPYKRDAFDLQTNDGSTPLGVAVSSSGNVGVANICLSACSVGSISIFPAGASAPCTNVQDSINFPRPTTVAFDAEGNLFVIASAGSGQFNVGEISGGCNARNIKLLTVRNALSPGGGIQVDGADHIVICDSRGILYTYNQPKRNSLGSPIAQVHLKSSFSPLSFTFLSTGAQVYTADTVGTSTPVLNEYSYPQGGKPLSQISVGGFFDAGSSVAVTPPLVP